MLGNTEDEGDLGIIGQDSELLVSDLTWLKSTHHTAALASEHLPRV
jgi:hypothetical protein